MKLTAEQCRAIQECHAADMTQAGCSRVTGIHPRTISSYANKHGLVFRDGRAAVYSMMRERFDVVAMDRTIREMVAAGATNAQIAVKVGRTVATIKRRVCILRGKGEAIPQRGVAGKRLSELAMAKRMEKVEAQRRVAASKSRAGDLAVAARGAAAGCPSRPVAAPAFIPRSGKITTTAFVWRREAVKAQSHPEWVMDRHLEWLAGESRWAAWDGRADHLIVDAVFTGHGLAAGADAAGVCLDDARARFNALAAPLRGAGNALPIDAGRLIREAIERRDAVVAFPLSAPGQSDRATA